MNRFDHQLYERDDDLSHCKVCGGAEGSLPTLCPGRRLTPDELRDIYASQLDFDTGPMAGAIWWKPATGVKEC